MWRRRKRVSCLVLLFFVAFFGAGAGAATGAATGSATGAAENSATKEIVAPSWVNSLINKMIAFIEKNKGAGAGGVRPACPEGWTPGPKSCYFIPTDPQRKNFGSNGESERNCKRLNGDSHLLSLETEEEQKFIEDLLAERGDSDWDFWTNGRKDSEGQWHWGGADSTLLEDGFLNWDKAHSQPQDLSYENCLFLGHRKSFHHKWHDHRCSYRCSYICELEPEAPVATTCPPDWVAGLPGENTCYFVPPDPQRNNFVTHYGAQDMCSQKNAELLSIETNAEQILIGKILKEKQDSEWDYWTSGHRGHDGKWRWGDSQTPFDELDFINWDEGQPQGGWEDCLFIGHASSYGHRWHDHRCSYRCSYICEMKVAGGNNGHEKRAMITKRGYNIPPKHG